MEGSIINLFTKPLPTQHEVDAEFISNYLSPDTNRYRHTLGVVRLMKKLLPSLPLSSAWKPMLIQACYLHDIGYSPKLHQYGFHPLDGAIFAAKQQFAKPIIAAVLFHSCAYEAAKEEDNPQLLAIYQQHYPLLDEQDQLFIKLVTYCDIQTAPTGETITLKERLAEIRNRYGPQHPVSQLMTKHQEYYEALIREVDQFMQSN